MNPRRRPIDPDREALALDRIDPEMVDTATFGLGGHVGAQCRVLDVISDSMNYGASKAACCRRIGISTRTAERWLRRRQAALDDLGDI